MEDALREPGVQITRQYILQLASNFNTSWQTIYKHKAHVETGCQLLLVQEALDAYYVAYGASH